MPSWFSSLESLLTAWWPALLIISVLMLVISVSMVPWLIVHLPADHFSAPPKPDHRHRLLRHALWLLRNSIALILLIAGILMLVLPGQGLLTILIALAIADFPGRRQLQTRIVRIPAIFKGSNWIRKHYQRPPFIHPDAGTKPAAHNQAPLS